ncbi:MAG: rod shape-determining protein [Actinobacteria bacterium]|nr:rod shape-determining protein [Actinomycetota bacterium]
MRFRAGIAIDLGTVTTLIWVMGKGLVLEEPSAIAIDTVTGAVTAVGREADALAGKEPQDTEVLFPLRDGVIADLEATAVMLHAFLRRVMPRRSLLRPAALACVPCEATWVERRAVVAATEARRPRCSVELVDEPVAAAAGAGVDLPGGAGAFVVDIGGGTTEIAAIAGTRVARSRSLRLGGNAMDEAIMTAARNELGVVLGRNATRRLKATLGLTGGPSGDGEAVGLDTIERTPRSVRVPGSLVRAALEPAVTAITKAVDELLSDIPPDLAEEIVYGKILLCGGGALLPGLASRIEATAGIGTLLADDPLRCVVRGIAEILESGGHGQEKAKGAAARAPSHARVR